VTRPPSLVEVWLQVLEPMERMRRESDLVKVFPSYLSGEDLFGLTEMAIVWVIESVRYRQIRDHCGCPVVSLVVVLLFF